MEYKNHEEVFKQGIQLKKTFDYMQSIREDVINLVRNYRPKEVVFIACGSSYWLSLSSSLTWQRDTGIRCSAIKSGDIVMEPACYQKTYQRPLVIAPSRSGLTSETLLALNYFKKWYNCSIISITEYEENDIMSRADLALKINWANEESVCQTRSFSNLYLCCIMMSAFISDNTNLQKDLLWYIDHSLALAEKAETQIQDLIRFPFTSLVTLGSGCGYGIACEGAYIVVEVAQFLSSYFGILEYRHGPIVTANEKTLISIFSNDDQYELEQNLICDSIKYKAKVMTISANHKFEGASWSFCLEKPLAKEAVALYGILVMQGIAYYTALRDNMNPDNPGELVSYINLKSKPFQAL